MRKAELRTVLALILLALGGATLAQTAQPTGPMTGATQREGSQPAGTVQEPSLQRQPTLDQPPPANPQPYGGSIGGPINETGRYDGLGQGAATSGGDAGQRSLVQPDYRRSDQPGTTRPGQ